MISATHDGFHELEHDLGTLPKDFPDKVKKVTARGAFNIKKDWRDRWSGHPHITGLARAVSYDVTARARDVEAEIGPDKAKPQGPLGNVIEFGGLKEAPIPAGMPALAAEEPRYVQAIADIAEEALSDDRVG